MKYFLLIFLVALLGCSRERRNQNSDMNFGKQLLDSGFLDFADASKLDSLKLGLINSFDIYDEANNRITHIDAEELAEFSFNFFLPRLNKILAKRQIELNVRAADDYDTSNDVFINSEKIKLYTKTELEKLTFWESASRNFFKEINRQLSSEKIAESFYLLYEGNDLHVLLLTVSQHKIIAEKYKSEPREIPYLP
jgi:hypothetical protein